MVASVSTDGGLTWSAGQSISSTVSIDFEQGVHIQTGPDGTVYATYVRYTGFPQDEPAFGMSKSTDGGVTWDGGAVIIDNIRGLRSTWGTVGKGGTRAASFPVTAVDITGGARNGTIYVVWPNVGVPGTNTGNDIDIYIISSADGGSTWTTPVKVNQDPSGLGKFHWMPWITCDPVTGALSVIFYDDRNVGANEAETWVANSLDGGATWDDFKVSDVSFSPAPYSWSGRWILRRLSGYLC